MLGVAIYTTIKTLWELGKNKTEIARATGHDWKTVAKVVKAIENGTDKPKYKDRDSIMESYRDEVIKFLDRGLSGIRIHEELEVLGFKGSYSTVRRYLQNMKKLTAKQKLELYQKRLAKISSLAIFCYASQKVSIEFLDPSDFKNTDLHYIVNSFQKIMAHCEDDFRKIALATGIDEKEIEEICNELIEKFKKNPSFPSR